MFEKIKTLKNMTIMIASCKNEENRKIYWKCYLKYMLSCVIMGKDEFVVKFGSEYYQNFGKRMNDWKEYIYDNIYKLFWKYNFFKKRKPNWAQYLITYGVSKPIHLKTHISVNEFILEYFAEKNGFRVASEYLTSLSSTYYIKKRD